MQIASLPLKAVLAADLHGNIDHYRRLLDIVKSHSITYVFLGGDLMPKNGGLWTLDNEVRTIGAQANFIKEFLVDYLQELGQYAYVFGVFGNDDFRSNYPLLKTVSKKVIFLDNEAVALPDAPEIWVGGYPYVRLTPFLQKDWDRWDMPGDITYVKNHPSKAVATEGYVSQGGNHHFVDFFTGDEPRKTMMNDLRALAQKSDPKKTIYIMHDAPYDTPLDMVVATNPYIGTSQHIGSKSIRAFIEEYQPKVTLHGHIHETYAVSGSYLWQSGNSWSLAAAHDFTGQPFACTIFDINNPESSNRLVV